MSGEIRWFPQTGIELAEKLNDEGNQAYTNIARIYYVFEKAISLEWSGANYNKVASKANDHIAEFTNMFTFLCINVPNTLYRISELHAEDGKGTVVPSKSSFYLNNNFKIVAITLDQLEADGRIKLSSNVKETYFTDNGQDCSIISCMNRAKEHVDNYVSIYESNLEMLTQNEALMEVYNKVLEFRDTLKTSLEEIVLAINAFAVAEITTIKTGNENTVRTAKSVSGCVSSGSTGFNNFVNTYNYVDGAAPKNTDPFITTETPPDNGVG